MHQKYIKDTKIMFLGQFGDKVWSKTEILRPCNTKFDNLVNRKLWSKMQIWQPSYRMVSNYPPFDLPCSVEWLRPRSGKSLRGGKIGFLIIGLYLLPQSTSPILMGDSLNWFIRGGLLFTSVTKSYSSACKYSLQEVDASVFPLIGCFQIWKENAGTFTYPYNHVI